MVDEMLAVEADKGVHRCMKHKMLPGVFSLRWTYMAPLTLISP